MNMHSISLICGFSMGKTMLSSRRSDRKVLHHPFYTRKLQKQTHPDEFCNPQRGVIKCDICNMFNKYS